MKIAANQSTILTDEEWRDYWTFYHKFETLEHYEQNLRQHKELQEYLHSNTHNHVALCDKVWHERSNSIHI